MQLGKCYGKDHKYMNLTPEAHDTLTKGEEIVLSRNLKKSSLGDKFLGTYSGGHK